MFQAYTDNVLNNMKMSFSRYVAHYNSSLKSLVRIDLVSHNDVWIDQYLYLDLFLGHSSSEYIIVKPEYKVVIEF